MKETVAMVSIKDRVKAIRTALKMSQREFGKPIYISQSLLTEIEVGRRKINNRTVQLIVAYYKVNKEWMMTGRGEMFSEPPPDMRKEKLLDVFNELDEMLQDYLLLQSKELLKIQKKKMSSPAAEQRDIR
jgi:transcriptional regulator with XRE-family HTH domain